MKLSETVPKPHDSVVDAASNPLPWEQMDQDQRFYALLMLINSLGKISEIQSEAISELQDKIQTLELSSAV